MQVTDNASHVPPTNIGNKYSYWKRPPTDGELAGWDEAARLRGDSTELILITEVQRMRAWVNDLQSGMYINCVYCGHRYGPDPGAPVAMADVLKEHIQACPEHPMAKLKIANEHLQAAMSLYRDALANEEDIEDGTEPGDAPRPNWAMKARALFDEFMVRNGVEDV